MIHLFYNSIFMKILKIVIALFFFTFTSANAQTKVLDSLQGRLDKVQDATEKVSILNAIAGEYIENDPQMMMDYARKALKLAEDKKLKQSMANSWLNIGNANIMMSRYTAALKSFTKSQELFEQLQKSGKGEMKEIKNGLARAYGSIGIVCSEQNNYAKALEYYFRALKIYEDTKQENIVARAYNNIGIVYKAQKEYGKALEYFNKALTVQRKIGDNTSAITITNIGNIHLAQHSNEKALQSYNEAMVIFREHENKRGLAELYNNLGNYYNQTGNTAAAEANYRNALQLFDLIGEKYGASASLAFMGNLYAAQGKNKEALSSLERSSNLATEIGVLEQVKESEKAISEIYERAGNSAEALKHYKKYSVARDSINNAENIKNIVREEMNYEFERKEALQKIEIEKKEAIYAEQGKRHQQQVVFIVLFVLLLAGIAFLIYNRLQLKKTLTLQRDLAEYEQKALHLQMNPHFVFNCLGSISSFIVQNGTDSAIKYLTKFSKLMRLTLEYSKESLIPIDKEIEGLQNYLELEQLRFNQLFEFSITKDPLIEDDMAIPPLLLQPFVENAIIHGLVPKKEKGTINVAFNLVNEKLVCTITDNGIGFSKSKELKENSVTVHKSMALEITRKRLEVIQAFTSKTSQVEIKEVLNGRGEPAGTRIILNLPIQYSSSLAS
ncbi:MAG: tetratricopeptide repeat protein [Flavobacterium sp.]|nr:MAG: tetratricopeptide repeat protein [Flavobacterium sp.]